MNELCIGFQGRLLYQILENIRMCFIRTSQAVLDFTRTFFSQLIPMIRKRSVSNVDTRDYLGVLESASLGSSKVDGESTTELPQWLRSWTGRSFQSAM